MQVDAKVEVRARGLQRLPQALGVALLLDGAGVFVNVDVQFAAGRARDGREVLERPPRPTGEA
eukprot:461298-Heterocapsa_arctica.AAC.1